MKLRDIASLFLVVIGIFLVGWLMGRHNGRNSVRMTETGPVSGVVTAEEVAKGMTESKPDTVYVPVPVYIREDDRLGYSTETQPVAPEVVPIETVEPGSKRDAAVDAVLIDWNTKRSYTGTLFDNKTVGTFSYAFDVQFNRAGQIDYRFDPAPIPKPRTRLRPTIGGEYYSNGQYAFGAGIQYSAFGLNVRALKLPKSATEDGYAFGIGAQIIF